MDPFQFERFIKEIYELLGYEAALTSKTGDGGKDIVLKKGKEMVLVECKRNSSTKATRPDIQKFHSAIIDMKAIKGIFVTTGVFTKQAMECVNDKPTELINGEGLINLLQEATENVTTEKREVIEIPSSTKSH